MIANAKTLTIIAVTCGGLLAACQGPDSEFREALPDRSMMVSVPSNGSTSQGLAPAVKSARISSSRQFVVGQAAEFYTDSFYVSRDLNTLAGFIVDLLEAITKLKPTGLTATNAVWGPLSQPLEPNEYILNVDKITDGALHYQWKLEGKPKGQTDDAYILLAGGAFEPGAAAGQGKGWFAIEFDNIHQLNPTDKSHGRIEYALGKDANGTLVLAHYKGPGDDGLQTEAFYAYGIDTQQQGFMVFAFPADIDNGADGVTTKEDVLIHTRWNASGAGRADVYATHGTLNESVVVGSQCWGKTFVSSFEDFKLDGKVLAASGDASTCVFSEAMIPQKTDLPTEAQTANPHPFQQQIKK